MKTNHFLLLLPVIMTACNVRNPWERIALTDAMGLYTCSSELDAVDPYEGLGAYGAHNLLDRDMTTAWSEGAEGDGIGEYVIIDAGKILQEVMLFRNGYQKTGDLFEANGRVKKLRMTLYVGYMIPGDVTELYAYSNMVPFGEPVEIGLEDNGGVQQVPIPYDREDVEKFQQEQLEAFLREAASRVAELQSTARDPGAGPVMKLFLKLEILEVYKGSRYEDTCISDIWFGKYIRRELKSIPEELDIEDVIKDDDEGIVYVVTMDGQKFLLADEAILSEAEDLVPGVYLYLEIMDISPDLEWVQVDHMYRQEVESRIEEIPHLYSTRYLTEVDLGWLEHGQPFSMYGFTEEDGVVCLEYDQGSLPLAPLVEQIRNGSPD